MMQKSLAALALAVAVAAPALPAAAQELTPEEVKRLALEAILENPEIVMEAVEILREREEAAQAEATRAAIGDMRLNLEEDPNAPVLGNPEGDVTVVEFFDYNCPYCKQASAEVKALLDGDPSVRLVHREWPILGEGSLFAARAALAAREQGKYEDFHWALMAERSRKDEAAVLRIAAEVGLDVEKLKADMEGQAVADHIAQSNDMAKALGFTGTPSFVIGEEAVFGFVPKDDLAGLIEAAREAPAE
jgi:protein-disulfide isomerase